MNPLRQKYSDEKSYLLDNVSKHKINLYAETGAIFEMVSKSGLEVKRKFNLDDCIVFNHFDNISTDVPDEILNFSIPTFGTVNLKRIKNIDYVKRNSLITFANGEFGIFGVLNGYIDERGKWIGDVGVSSTVSGAGNPHKIDGGILNALPQIFDEESSVVDFGCGNADYIKKLIENGFKCEAYDGNLNTPQMTGGIGKVLDLSKEFDLNKKFDYVISLEVAEHIPKEYEEIYVNNLIRHTDSYLIISWAVKGQGGDGHVNEQDEEYVLNLYKEKGMVHQKEISEALRSISTLGWFKETIFVFGWE